MEIKNNDLIKLIQSFKGDLEQTIKENSLNIEKDSIDELFEYMLLSYLDAVPLGVTDFSEMVESQEKIEEYYEAMNDFDDNPDQVYADAWQAKW